MTIKNRGKARHLTRKIHLVLSLLAVVSLLFVSSNHTLAQDGSSSRDQLTFMAGMCADLGDGHVPADQTCYMQACPYCFPMEDTHSVVLQMETVNFTHNAERGLPSHVLPFKRPPRAVI